MHDYEPEPNWLLVTDNFEPPKSFSDLLSLLIPRSSNKERLPGPSLTWKAIEFYKKENLISFIQFGIKAVAKLPKFHKDEMPTILRIVRLCQEVGWYKKAYAIMEKQQLVQFIFTSLELEQWDSFTKAAAWNYIIVKQKAFHLEEKDYTVWNRIKYDQEWVGSYDYLASVKEMIECKLLYLCREAKTMERNEFEELMMELAIYCNSVLPDLYTYDIVSTYKRCMNYLEHYTKNRIIIDCHYAILAQLAEFFYDPYEFLIDDYLEIMRDIMEHIDYSFYYKYKEFIGMLLSYIPFFEMIHVRKQIDYFQEILNKCRGNSFKEEMLREYVFSQITVEKSEFLYPFFYNQYFDLIQEIVTNWCTPEQRMVIESLYTLNIKK